MKYLNKISKLFSLLFVFCLGFILIGCKEINKEKDFTEIVNETKSYKASGIMESFYLEGRKQNEFNVLYKSDNEIKVVLKSVDSEDSQIILKSTYLGLKDLADSYPKYISIKEKRK